MFGPGQGGVTGDSDSTQQEQDSKRYSSGTAVVLHSRLVQLGGCIAGSARAGGCAGRLPPAYALLQLLHLRGGQGGIGAQQAAGR